MSKKFLKLTGLLVFLVVAGAAWAAVTGGLLTTSTTGATNLTDDASFNATGKHIPFTLSGGTTVTLGGNVTLPTAVALAKATAEITSSDVQAYWQVPVLLPLIGEAKAKDFGGFISLEKGQTLNIRPGLTYSVGGYDKSGTAETAADTNKLGMLRIAGEGTVNVYAANNNMPTETGTIYANDYNGGTLLYGGRLNVAHSSALGVGPVRLIGGTTLGIIDNNASFGYGNAVTDAGRVDLYASQKVWVGRSDIQGTTFTDNTIDGGSNNIAATNTVPVTIDVGKTADRALNVRFFGIEEARNYGAFDNAGRAYDYSLEATLQGATDLTSADFSAVQIVKTGPGSMFVDADGLRHTGGTAVNEGSLTVEGEQSRIFTGELGETWGPNPSESRAIINQSTVTAGNYNADFARAHTNHLAIAEDATVTVDRHQFFGNLSGKGSLHVGTFTKDGATVFPQITVQTNALTGNNGIINTDSHFEGSITSDGLNLVLNTDATDTSRAQAANKKLQLSGTNNITSGDTYIVGGILSVASTAQLPPNTIRIGSGAGYRGFVGGVVPTLHISTESEVNQPVEIYQVGDSTESGNNVLSKNPNLAVSTGAIASFPKITITGTGANPTANNDNGNATLSINRGVLPFNKTSLWDTPREWDGTIAFSDEYSFSGTSNAVTAININRGTLHLAKTPVEGWASVAIHSEATLSIGANARDFTQNLDVILGRGVAPTAGTANWDAAQYKIRLVPLASDIKASQEEAQSASSAVATFARINYLNLGTGNANNTRRLILQLDLSEVGESLKAGSWIKLISSSRAFGLDALHYQRESSTGPADDLVKIDIGTVQRESYNRNKIEAVHSLNDETIYIKVTEDVSPSVPDDPEEEPTLTAPALTPSETVAAKGATVTFRVGEWSFTDETGTTTPDVTVDYDEPTITGDAEIVENNLATDGTIVVKVNADATEGSSVTVSVLGTYDELTETATGSLTVAGGILAPQLSLTVESTTTNTITGTVTYLDATGAGAASKKVTVSAQAGTQTPISVSVVTAADGKVAYTIPGLTAATAYSVGAVDDADPTVIFSYGSVTTKTAGSSSGGSSSGGCDAGFAGLALLLAAPLFLRKKD